MTALFDLGAEGISGEILLGGFGSLATGLSQALALPLHEDHETLTSVAIANQVGLVLLFSPLDGIEGFHIHFWQGYLAKSQAGEELGRMLVAALEEQHIAVETTGMSLPVLRETPMTALVIEQGNLSEQEVHAVVTVFEEVLRQVIHR